MKTEIRIIMLGILILAVISGCLQSPESKQLDVSKQLEVSDVQVINMTVDADGWNPDTFVLQRGEKVKWVINVKELTNCNKEIIVRDYGLDIKLKNGENIVEFTPEKTGAIKWSCWMDMIPGTFIVVNDTTNEDEIARITDSILPDT